MIRLCHVYIGNEPVATVDVDRLTGANLPVQVHPHVLRANNALHFHIMSQASSFSMVESLPLLRPSSESKW